MSFVYCVSGKQQGLRADGHAAIEVLSLKPTNNPAGNETSIAAVAAPPEQQPEYNEHIKMCAMACK